MRKVLIISDSFPPGFAPRMGYLAKYLKTFGWDGEAIAPLQTRQYNFDTLIGNINFHDIGNYSNDSQSFFSRAYRLLMRFFKRRWSWRPLDEKMYIKAKDVLESKHFDLILCSTSGFFPLEVACRISTEFHLPLILDFRDIYEQTLDSFKVSKIDYVFTKLYRERRNRIISKARVICTVSPWHTNYLAKYNRNCKLIYNGYDPELFFFREFVKTKIFNIIYTGTVTPFNRFLSPDWLFEAIARLAHEGVIEVDKFYIKFYTDEKSQIALKPLIDEYGISEFVRLEGWVKASLIPELLSAANVLLVLAANTGTKGVLTTKLFEYMAIGRTILCLPSDESCIKEMLATCRAGYAATSYQDTYDFLFEKYNEWKHSGIVKCDVDFEVVKQFSRERQAGQFVDIFNHVIG